MKGNLNNGQTTRLMHNITTLNKWVFSFALNTSTEHAGLMSLGRLFHYVGAGSEKACSPTVFLQTLGTLERQDP